MLQNASKLHHIFQYKNHQTKKLTIPAKFKSILTASQNTASGISVMADMNMRLAFLKGS